MRRLAKEIDLVKNSLKAEQTRLLRLEKEVVALAAGIGALTGAANAKELLGAEYAEQSSKLTEAYLNLVQTLQAAHDLFGQRAAEAGIALLKAGGTPKDPITESVKSALGIG